MDESLGNDRVGQCLLSDYNDSFMYVRLKG